LKHLSLSGLVKTSISGELRFNTVARYLNWWSLCILLLSIYFYSLLIVQVQNL
jgi:hypothetical protein